MWISPRTPDLARSLRDWGDFVHIRHIAAAAIPGFTQISVYENTAAGDPRYMHFYEFDNAEAEATFDTMIANVAPRLGGTAERGLRRVGRLAAAGRATLLLQHLHPPGRGGGCVGLDIPRLEMSSSLRNFLCSVTPCDVLVVGAVVVEAAVEDADETVAEGP